MSSFGTLFLRTGDRNGVLNSRNLESALGILGYMGR